MARSRHKAVGFAAAVALAALGTAGANHFILPCDDQCNSARWTVTGSLNMPRAGHTATLLPDGKVLVAGGARDAGVLDSAELYDPATGAWSVTAAMAVPRSGHTATLLADGRVLVAGGDSAYAFAVQEHGSAEIFDPAAQAWIATGPMHATRWAHTAVRLEDGRVLAAGGYGGANVRAAELYDPATDTWSPTGDLEFARYGHTMFRLDDGTVLLVGGVEDNDLALTLPDTEIYDPSSGEWRRLADAPGHGSRQPATALPDGSVLLTGGSPPYVVAGGDVVFGMAQRFDPDSRSWSAAAGLLTPRVDHTATALASGHVLVAGGMRLVGISTHVQYATLAATERFDPDTATWHAAGALNFARTGHTATLLADGTVLAAGGYVVGPEHDRVEVLASAERYGSSAAARQTVAPQAGGRSRRTP